MVTGDTYIQLKNGEMRPIESIKSGTEIVSIDMENTQQLIEQSGDKVSKETETVTVTLDSQLSVRGDADASVIVRPRSTRIPEWKQLRDIEKGDNVAIAQELPFFGKTDNKDSWLLGIMIGAGDYATGRSSVSLVNDEVINYLASKAKVMELSREVDEHERQRKIVSIDGIEQKLESAGIANQTKQQRTLPKNWETYSKESLTALIEGLIDSDSNIFIEENRKPVLYFTCNGKQLAEQILFALMKFGIHGKIEERQETYKRNQTMKQKNPIWIVWVRGKENFNIICDNFASKSKEKQAVMDEAKRILKRHNEKIQDNIISTALRFEKVVEVAYSGKNKVYGFDIDNFVANGIFVKNRE